MEAATFANAGYAVLKINYRGSGGYGKDFHYQWYRHWGLEMQDGGKAWLVHLRRGMKWSDGKPFTADDFVFWFEDIYQNKDLIPTPSAAMAINGKQGEIQRVMPAADKAPGPMSTPCAPPCTGR